ncbi:hypothetical protein C0J52_02718 [Blattella germanica]|nr:hypothetical protein C0J52_02718 [Blattella germanica]
MEEIFTEEEFSNHRLWRLKSITAQMLKPIESAWSCLKAAVKRNLCMQLPQILAGEDRVNIPQYEYRLRHLENLINQNMKSKNVNNCARYVSHISLILLI